MNKPTLAEFAQLAEVVAALAVVVSLVYVGRELRSNTAAIRAEALQNVSERSQDLLLTTAADSALSRIVQLGDRDLGLLTESEAHRYGLWVRQSFFTLQNVYFQNELDVLDPRVWAGYRRVICERWGRPGVRTTWDLHRDVFDPAFAGLVEGCAAM